MKKLYSLVILLFVSACDVEPFQPITLNTPVFGEYTASGITSNIIIPSRTSFIHHSSGTSENYVIVDFNYGTTSHNTQSYNLYIRKDVLSPIIRLNYLVKYYNSSHTDIKSISIYFDDVLYYYQ